MALLIIPARTMTQKARFLLNIILVFLIVVLDQVTKRTALYEIGLGESKEFIPGVIQFVVFSNTGGAFSIFKEYPIIFKIIGLINVFVFSYFALYPLTPVNKLVGIGSACILGGTIGNLLDRFLLGAVIDFLDFEFVKFAVFNLADVFIDIGVILIVVGCLKTKN